jgi:APA family basic amino acid/polyamine antiporter
MPDAPRAFKTPFMPFTPIFAVLACIALMFSLAPDSWARLALWLALGGVVYGAYGYRHSRLRAR